MTATNPGMPLVWDEVAVTERLGGDREIVAEIIDLLLEDIPPRVAALQETTELDALRKVAHSIKGALADGGGDAAAAAMHAVERAAAQGDSGAVAPLVQDATAAWTTLERTLKQWRKVS